MVIVARICYTDALSALPDGGGTSDGIVHAMSPLLRTGIKALGFFAVTGRENAIVGLWMGKGIVGKCLGKKKNEKKGENGSEGSGSHF